MSSSDEICKILLLASDKQLKTSFLRAMAATESPIQEGHFRTVGHLANGDRVFLEFYDNYKERQDVKYALIFFEGDSHPDLKEWLQPNLQELVMKCLVCFNATHPSSTPDVIMQRVYQKFSDFCKTQKKMSVLGSAVINFDNYGCPFALSECFDDNLRPTEATFLESCICQSLMKNASKENCDGDNQEKYAAWTNFSDEIAWWIKHLSSIQAAHTPIDHQKMSPECASQADKQNSMSHTAESLLEGQTTAAKQTDHHESIATTTTTEQSKLSPPTIPMPDIARLAKLYETAICSVKEMREILKCKSDWSEVGRMALQSVQEFCKQQVEQ